MRKIKEEIILFIGCILFIIGLTDFQYFEQRCIKNHTENIKKQ